jgi:hypothetical protein
MPGEEWMSIKEASTRLLAEYPEKNITYPRLLRLVQKGTLETKEDVLDARIKLINIEEVKKLYRIQ